MFVLNCPNYFVWDCSHTIKLNRKISKYFYGLVNAVVVDVKAARHFRLLYSRNDYCLKANCLSLIFIFMQKLHIGLCFNLLPVMLERFYLTREV